MKGPRNCRQQGLTSQFPGSKHGSTYQGGTYSKSWGKAAGEDIVQSEQQAIQGNLG